MSSDERGHSSYTSWLVYKFRAIERILPNLKTGPKHAWVVPFLLCFLLLAVMVGMGVYVDGYASILLRSTRASASTRR